MRKTLILSAAIAVIAMLCGCGATQPTTSQTAKTDSVKILPLSTADMQALPETPNAEVLTLKDALLILQGEQNAKEVMKKYGYKYKANYEVSMLDKFKNLYYKNCTLPKMIREGVYTDLPKPVKKGISSYVAINDNIEIGVFNSKAYEQLLNQVKACGFTLVAPGYEDEYQRGSFKVFCYAGGKRIRVQKSNTL
ncbi:MAG: hypothetical protein SO442_02290 [Prevotella sp.]|nr:hypothetical protein [Prevotella sp.]MDD7336464.1 hypothetical protein [Prevotella sp.]MDY4625415.1 hypothetical protein [Prevotella sp.]MDY4667630.1 hypothetical protein [Prevotella sp.]MDY5258340.1 hypothetical protein [Prevotella sp.]